MARVGDEPPCCNMVRSEFSCVFDYMGWLATNRLHCYSQLAHNLLESLAGEEFLAPWWLR